MSDRYKIKHRRKFNCYEIIVNFSAFSKETILDNIETKEGAQRIVKALTDAYDQGFDDGYNDGTTNEFEK